MISHSKLSPVVRESNKDIINTFRDSYVFEFLNLPEPHNESDLKQGLISQMKKFILELGKISCLLVKNTSYKLVIATFILIYFFITEAFNA